MAANASEPSSTALAPTQDDAKLARRSPVDSVRAALEKMKPQFAMALPKHLTADRLLRVAMTAIQTTPKLLECDRTSLYRAVMTCAQLGLEPDGVLGQAYLVPFAGKVQFIPGYRGLISLARNSGEVTSISAQAVHENDAFEYAFGLEEKLVHVPARGDRGEITHFYAVARFKDGGHHFDVMTRAEVLAIRDGSQGYRAAVKYAKDQAPDSPWAKNFPEMGKKTVIRRIAKYLPMNVQKAAALADMYDAGRHSHIDDYGEIAIDVESTPVEEPTEVAPSKLDAFAGAAASAEEQQEAADDDAPAGTLFGATEDATVKGKRAK